VRDLPVIIGLAISRANWKRHRCYPNTAQKMEGYVGSTRMKDEDGNMTALG